MKRKSLQKGFYFPLRFKILISVLIVVTVVVGVITFRMAKLFHNDKKDWIHQFASMTALHTSQETRTIFDAFHERLQVFGRLLYDDQLIYEQKKRLIKMIFEDFHEFVAVTIYEDGKELFTIQDMKMLNEARLAKEDFIIFRTKHPLPFDRIQSGQVFVRNSTMSEKLPTMTLAVPFDSPDGKSVSVVAAVVCLESLLRVVERSDKLNPFLVDDEGIILADTDYQKVIRRTPVDLPHKLDSLDKKLSLAKVFTIEYIQEGVEMVGGFARVDFGNILVRVQVPKSTAYSIAKQKLKDVILVSLIILTVFAILSLFWSHRITRPIEKLSVATDIMGKGQFDIKIDIKSRDEIGNLADSFNKMATELKTREEALQQTQTQLIYSEKMVAFGQLGAGIAHEIKNPLAGILGYTQLSLRKVEKGDPLYNNLTIIEKETKRCKSIIENLLKFTRQEKVRFGPIEINNVVQDAIAIVDHQLGINQIRLEKELATDLPEIMGNANQIQQVLMNILINAQQAMEGRPGLVKIKTFANNGHITVKISDNGPGIPEEFLTKLFEPFFTTKPVGKGTGLGLSVSYGIIRDHGGDILVESEPGKGATFVIKFPLKDSNKQIHSC
ncbi:MAG: ATP-binding protein [bacterium]